MLHIRKVKTTSAVAKMKSMSMIVLRSSSSSSSQYYHHRRRGVFVLPTTDFAANRVPASVVLPKSSTTKCTNWPAESSNQQCRQYHVPRLGNMTNTRGTLNNTSITSNSSSSNKNFSSFIRTPTDQPYASLLPRRQQRTKRCKSSAAAIIDIHEDDEDDVDSSSANNMTTKTPFILADIGEGIAEVELMQWFVQVGDHLHQFDRVCEVQSDKATVEITSRYDGYVHSLEHQVGDMVKVGQPLLFIVDDPTTSPHAGKSSETVSAAASSSSVSAGTGQQGASTAASSESAADVLSSASASISGELYDEKLHIPTIASQYHFDSDNDSPGGGGSAAGAAGLHRSETSVSNHNNSKVLTSPAIRKLAMEYNLNLSTIVGTGPKGRVTKGDVLTVLKERGIAVHHPHSHQNDNIGDSSFVAATDSLGPAPSISQKQEQVISTSVTNINDVELPLKQDTALKLRGYNRLMVQSMTAALQIPHMVYSDELDLTKFLRYKADLSPESFGGFLPFTIKAVSKALEKYPLLNASFTPTNDGDSSSSSSSLGDVVTLWRNHNIGIAMDTPRGLIVPVLKECQDKSIPELADQLKLLKDAAGNGTLSPEDLTGATFTLSNIGAIGSGGTYMSPVVTPPQVAIGAIGKIQRLPRFVSANSTEVQEANICVVSWGGDHRVVDGATIARFHSTVKGYIEDPVTMLMEMK